MLTILRLILFGISSLGSWELIRRRSNIHVYFLPSLTIAVQITVLFLAGILNLLGEAAILLFVVGICGILYSVIKDRSLSFLKNYMGVGFLFLALVSVVMLIFVYGKIFAHNDNFSHWALVVKTMFASNRFPNFLDETVLFQQYPLGSASFIYYFAKVVSGSESVQMFAQIYMMTTCIMPLFIFCKKNRIAALVAVLAATNFFFIYNVQVTNLLVDTLLPLEAMCCGLYAYMYGQKIIGKIEFYALIFYLTALVQTKNSGMFFAAIIALWLFVNIRRDKKVFARLIVILLPLFSVLLWRKHCSYVFVAAESSKHAMSAEYYSSVIGAKTAEEIRTISSGLFRFSVTWKDVWLTFGFLLLVGVLVFLFAKKDRMTYIKVSLIGIILYVVYQIGLLAMYLFSMPSIEAAYLAEIERYTRSILIVVLYMVMVMAVKMISDVEMKALPAACVSAVVVAAFFGYMLGSKGTIRTAVQYTDNPEERNWIESAMEEYKVPLGASYCILPEYDDGAYSYFMGMFLFESPAVNEIVVDEESDLDYMPYQYIFVYDQDNEIIEKWEEKNYPDQVGNDVIIRYDLMEGAY